MTNRPFRVFSTGAWLALMCLLAGASPAEAYIDPGSGSLAYQVILAAALGALFFVQRLRTRATAFFRGLSGRPESARPQEPV